MGERRFLNFLGMGMIALLFSGCAETQLLMQTTKSLGSGIDSGNYKVGNPYKIKGVWYYPKEDWEYDETGIASWYGPNFHGKKTANGEIYDMNDVTAAHKTLPMPSFVQVTNLENGRSLQVRVNDRGPYAHSRIIDLSRRSAQLLGFKNKGTAKVRVRILRDKSLSAARNAGRNFVVSKDETPITVDKMPKANVTTESLAPPKGASVAPQAQPTQAPLRQAPLKNANIQKTVLEAPKTSSTSPVTSTTATVPSNIFVQIGAFREYANANRVRAILATVGEAKITSISVKGQELFRVRMGPLQSVEAADGVLDQVIGAGYSGAKVVVD